MRKRGIYLILFLGMGMACQSVEENTTSTPIVIDDVRIPYESQGLWTSADELKNIPMSGPAWYQMLEAADLASGTKAYISDQDYVNNVQILAAAIVYLRTGNVEYKDKVIVACQKLEKINDMPPIPNTGRDDYNRTLSWGREVGAYILAADLIGYKTALFDRFCIKVAEVWRDVENDWTLHYTFLHRPNNWGTHAFSTLAIIYSYLGEQEKLDSLYDYKVNLLTGKGDTPELQYGDLCWQMDEDNPIMINPKGAIKNGINIDGVAPDDMRRGGCLAANPEETGYAWEYLHGELAGTRVLSRLGYPIYAVADSAYKRAVYALQVRWSAVNEYWYAQGDDESQILFWDEAFGTNYSSRYHPSESRLYGHGKSFGWAYVTLSQ